ncbi:hypothetical protein C2S52_015872 [Perilla frutescens var. hirtella]|nr:hypothetical protein C2S52_015872 [Perilla frutescens var. hirtella]KAH6815339.1 hypothetical protein C2S51_020159 [Perilla frutescens var. frutescens]
MGLINCSNPKRLNHDSLAFIKILRHGVVRAITRLLLLASFLLLSFSLLSVFRPTATSSSAATDSDSAVVGDYWKILPIICQDLVDRGLIKKGHNGLILGGGGSNNLHEGLFRDGGVGLMTDREFQEAEEEEKAAFDFVLAPFLNGIGLVDRVVKNGGMMISPLTTNLLKELHSLTTDYRIVYLRIFDNAVVAIRKSAHLF